MDAKNISKERDKIDKFAKLRLLTLKCEAFVVVTGKLEEDEGSCPGGGGGCAQAGWEATKNNWRGKNFNFFVMFPSAFLLAAQPRTESLEQAKKACGAAS